jgi:hypothetical protein
MNCDCDLRVVECWRGLKKANPAYAGSVNRRVPRWGERRTPWQIAMRCYERTAKIRDFNLRVLVLRFVGNDGFRYPSR